MPKLLAAANEQVQGAKVRAVRVLAPASVKTDPATAAATSTTRPAPPVVPADRRPPPEGYRRAIEAHRKAFRPSQLDPAIAAAMERQTAAMRELSRRAFPAPESVPAATPTPIDQARVQHRREAGAIEAAALRRAREEKADRPKQSGQLGRTA
ncbi:hypothetical protein ABZ829_22200 [Streptomyces xanthochromogenes]|uniref:hypothetical protein n=1 Tax=Streptomyces xanthochromogenes TaxID=67384 RepID=UPI003443B41D